jgi:hypothetical protein
MQKNRDIKRQLQNFSFQLPTYQGSVLEAFRRTKLRSCCKTPMSFATGSKVLVYVDSDNKYPVVIRNDCWIGQDVFIARGMTVVYCTLKKVD